MIMAIIAWKKGADIGVLLEREGLHPRALLPNRVTVQEVREPKQRVKSASPVEEPEEDNEADDYVSQEGSSGELQALEAMGFLQPGADFVMAIDDNGRAIRKKKIGSLGIGGRQGVGKTVSMLSLVTQAIPKYDGNIKFLVVDPHMHIDPEEEEADNSLAVKLAALGPFLLKVPGMENNPVSGGKKLMQWLQWLEKEYKERLGTEEKPGKKADCYIAVVIDEFGSLLNDPQIGNELVSLIVQINEQARKVKMFVLVASPTWKASRMGGTDLRNSIAAFVIHNMPSAIAGQIVDPDVARMTTHLKTGQAIIYDNGEAETGWIPFAQPIDLAYYVEKYRRKAIPLLPAPKHVTANGRETASPTGQAIPATKQGGVISSDMPSYEEGLLVHRYYSMLRDVSDESDELIVAKIAVLVYGNGEAKGKVIRAMQLKEKHGV
jgi:hypothetical protein